MANLVGDIPVSPIKSDIYVGTKFLPRLIEVALDFELWSLFAFMILAKDFTRDK